MRSLALTAAMFCAGCAHDYGDPVVNAMVSRRATRQWEAQQRMQWMSPLEKRALVPKYVWALQHDDDEYARQHAAQQLGVMDRLALDAVPALEHAAVNDPTELVRHMAALSLARMGQSSGRLIVQKLVFDLRGTDRFQRYMAFLAATKRPYNPRIEPDSGRWVAARELDFVANGAAPVDLSEARRALEEALKDPSDMVRRSAAEALRSLRHLEVAKAPANPGGFVVNP